MKKWISLIMICVICFVGIIGCGNNNLENKTTIEKTGDAEGSEDKMEQTASDLEPVTLEIWSVGEEYPAQERVMEQFCKTYKNELNLEKIQFNYISVADYEDKVLSLVASGDDFDAMFVSDWLLFEKIANKKGLLKLNDLIEEHAPTLYQDYKDNNILAAGSVGEDLLALPYISKKCSKRILLYRSDLAEEYGIDVSNLRTIEDLDRMLMEVREKIPDIIPFESGFAKGSGNSDVLRLLCAKYGYADMNYHNLTFRLSDEIPELQCIEQTEMFREAVYWMNKWYQEGIVSKNELSEQDNNMFDHGKTFARLDIIGEALSGAGFEDENVTYAYTELYEDSLFILDSPMNNGLALNQNAANPERFLMLLELLNTNQEAYDLFMYGIEGDTYVVDENGVYQYPEGQSSLSSEYLDWFRWPFKRSKLDRPAGEYTLEIMEQEDKWEQRENLIVSPLEGFAPDTGSIQKELLQREQLYEEKGVLLLAGILQGNTVDVAVDSYIEAQKNAGADKIISYLQRETDIFIKNKKE